MSNTYALNPYPNDSNSYLNLNITKGGKKNDWTKWQYEKDTPWIDRKYKGGASFTDKYSEDISFPTIGQATYNRNFEEKVYEHQRRNMLDENNVMQFEGLIGGSDYRITGVIAPKEYIYVDKKTGRKKISKKILSKY
jgi:hypothetical protein